MDFVVMVAILVVYALIRWQAGEDQHAKWRANANVLSLIVIR
jgi:hypothetical protein